jgi:hypothetical protein
VALTKSQFNERFYDTVGAEIVFKIEAQGYLDPYAVAKLLAAQTCGRGTRELKLLELGAKQLPLPRELAEAPDDDGDPRQVELERIDYFAVELARRSLEAFVAGEDEDGFQRVVPGAAGRPLVGTR